MVQEQADAAKAQLALTLWRRFFADGDECWTGDGYGWEWCFFCANEYPEHYPDCVYVKAKEMLRGEQDDG